MESMPVELKDETIQFLIAKALYLIRTPLKALYKAIIKEKC